MRSLTRSLTLAAVALAAGLARPAVAEAQYKFFGAIGGATLSDITDDFSVYDTKDRWGGNAGVILGLRTVSRLSISLEPAWSQMGGADGGIDYVETPLLVGGMGRSSDANRFGGYSGIMPAFKLSCGIEQPANACDDLKSSSWFIPLGARFYRKTSPGTFVGLDVRYLIPLGSSFDTYQANQRSWAFRLVFVKGEL